ncbi:MAG: GTP-binding protein, partial [Acetobacteraceae bacterium]|nr:GTP-binding protein [Acetobacteraceae bacterium]
PDAVARQRRADPSVEHDNPLAEVYEDQLQAADLVVLNKADLLDPDDLHRLSGDIAAALPPTVKLLPAREGRLAPAVLLGLAAAAEDDLASRPSHHDAMDGAHEHDDFESFVVPVAEVASPETLLVRLRGVTEAHDILRIKGFVAVRDKPMRLVVQGVGARFRHHFDRAWQTGEKRSGALVVIGETGLAREAIARAIAG